MDLGLIVADAVRITMPWNADKRKSEAKLEVFYVIEVKKGSVVTTSLSLASGRRGLPLLPLSLHPTTRNEILEHF